MKKKISRLICAVACCVPVALQAQTSEKITSPVNLYKEGKELFLQKNYAAAMPPLRTFVRQKADVNLKEEAEYMLVCSAYELKARTAIAQLRSYLDTYPDTPHANRIYALIASAYFYQGNYDEALALFNSSRLDLLGNEERDDMTYQLATCYLKVGNVKEAAIWIETLKASSPKYANDCSYYISYIRYTQKRYDEALKGFLPLQDDAKYKALVPYYIAEIYAIKKNYDKAQIVAQNYLSAYPQNEHAAEMYRILGDAYYHFGDYHKAVTSFRNYLEKENAPRRDALYMLGLSYFQTGVFSKAAETLGEVTTENDALTQNAYLHMGLAYLHLAEKNKARMAFEQAAASNANPKIKEQAAYNYALCIHETSYSAFGESVTVFEKFLNEFPTSEYAEMVSSYLVEVYMNTRSYEAALKSIDRISYPGKRILEAKQRSLFQLGTQAFANTQFEQSIGYFDRSLGLGQYNRQTKADALYWRGEAYYRLNRMEEAKRNFTDYLQLTQQTNNEMYALAHYNLGYIAFHQKDYVQAQNWFRKYISLEKGENKTALADAYNRIGDCYLDVRNFDEAKHYYSQAEAMNTPSGDYSFYQLALVSGLQKDYSGKITWLNRLAGKYPASPYDISALYEKGRSYVLLDKTQQAITSFKELLAKYPESPVSRKAAAEICLLYYQNEDYNQAIDAYKQVVQKYPGSDEARLAMRDLKSIYVRSDKGEMIQLENLITLEENVAPPQLNHYNRFLSATVSAGLAKGKTIGQGLDEMDRIAEQTLGDDFRTALAGDSKEFRESSSSLIFAFLLAIVLIYLTLAAQFESFKDPLVIMLTVPLAIAGALVFMAANGQTMNIFSQIGIIMLIGLVAKNGILIVEFANQKQEAGIDKLHAIEEASLQRLRPILMTSASTILGLLPLTVATGEGANGRIAMGIAVVGGMVVSTLLTLYIVPAIYSYVSTDRSKKQK